MRSESVTLRIFSELFIDRICVENKVTNPLKNPNKGETSLILSIYLFILIVFFWFQLSYDIWNFFSKSNFIDSRMNSIGSNKYNFIKNDSKLRFR